MFSKLDDKVARWFEKPLNVIIALILFFPIGIYFMWKNSVWKFRTRIIITLSFGVAFLLGGLLPKPLPRFEYGAFYEVSEVNNWVMPNCDQCGDKWYIRFVDEKEGYIISTFYDMDRMKKWGGMCRTTFQYYKTENGISIDMFTNKHVSTMCTNQFGGDYDFKELKWSDTGKPMGWFLTNSNVKLELDQKIKYVEKYLR